MLRDDYAGENCSVARALEAVGERWTLLIVRELLRRPSRFSTLQRRLAIAKNVLAKRLDKLVEIGVAEKVEVERARDWNIYRLTRRGEDLYPVISALMAWGDAHASPDGPPVVLRHSCGEAVGHRLVCAGCGEPVESHATRGFAGPGWVGDLDEWARDGDAPGVAGVVP